ncbi:MAG: LysM peptidoglycan-binding domain-containing M23 family metallopeptidase [Deltaproteobacteria bacterium]|nr:LysM peptidoglycan-binding domain-containing M23 family metallopeptidase [Deltaproteobacteria bacterium]
MRAGQTVWDIADAAGLTVEEVVEVNGLQSADEVAAGQVLFIPAAEPPKSATPDPITEPRPSSSSETLLWPLDGIVLRDFSTKTKGSYDGVLLAAPPGTLVRAAAAGSVAFAGTQGTTTGTFVVVEHPGELVTVYAHLKSASVTAGQAVQAGDVVGEIGASGLSGVSPRLQFQVRHRKAPVDPLTLLPP